MVLEELGENLQILSGNIRPLSHTFRHWPPSIHGKVTGWNFRMAGRTVNVIKLFGIRPNRL
ncbi:Uncharacterised protein [Vibrio cholerae]|nr:Uncharacterised protein [Vibrio cholerae]